MRRAERIRKLRAIEKDFEASSNAIYRAWEELGDEKLPLLLPGDDSVTKMLRDHVKKFAWDDLSTTPIWTAAKAVRNVRRLMDGKP